MTNTHQCQGSISLFRVHKLLQKVYEEIFQDSNITHTAN